LQNTQFVERGSNHVGDTAPSWRSCCERKKEEISIFNSMIGWHSPCKVSFTWSAENKESGIAALKIGLPGRA